MDLMPEVRAFLAQEIGERVPFAEAFEQARAIADRWTF